MQRVKVYRLNPEGLWDDKGTGSVSVEYLEVWVEKRRAERLDERTDRLTSSVAVEFAVSSIFFFSSLRSRPRPCHSQPRLLAPLLKHRRPGAPRHESTKRGQTGALQRLKSERLVLSAGKKLSPPFSPSLPFPSRTRPLDQNHNSNPTRPGSSSSRRRTPGRS